MASSKEIQDFVSREQKKTVLKMKFPAKAAYVFETDCYHV